MDSATLIPILTAVIGVATGFLAALKAVAPHTQTKLDDEIVDYGEKALPYAVRLLEWLRK